MKKLPNIAELFGLFPYVMFFNRTNYEVLDGRPLHEYKYSYPLSNPGEDQVDDSELLVYFKPESMDLDRIVVRANSLNITSPFTLFAS